MKATITLDLSEALKQQTRTTPGWTENPSETGFYVRWKRGDGMDILYFNDASEGFIIENDGAKFFGPFALPL